MGEAEEIIEYLKRTVLKELREIRAILVGGVPNKRKRLVLLEAQIEIMGWQMKMDSTQGNHGISRDQLIDLKREICNVLIEYRTKRES